MATLIHPKGTTVTVPDDVAADYLANGWSVAGADVSPVADTPPERPVPNRGSSKADWVAYAESAPGGVPEGFDSLTRDQLAEHYLGAKEPADAGNADGADSDAGATPATDGAAAS